MRLWERQQRCATAAGTFLLQGKPTACCREPQIARIAALLVPLAVCRLCCPTLLLCTELGAWLGVPGDGRVVILTALQTTDMLGN